MSDNHKFIAGLLLGAAAGAALALFLNSDKGKEMMSHIKDDAGKMEDSLQDKLQEFDTAVNDLLQKGKSFIEDLEQKAGQSTF